MKNKKSNKEITHLVYKISSIDDILHRFSPKGYELLTDEFVYSQELAKPHNKMINPIVTEITGASLSDEQKAIIEKTVKVNYGLNATLKKDELRKCIIKTFWFLLSFIISSALLFISSRLTDELVINLCYLPFWFFGYRIITYPLFELLPMLHEKRYDERLATMTIIFTDSPINDLPKNLIDKIWAEEKDKVKEFNKGLKNFALTYEYFIEGDTVELECNINGKNDLLSSCYINNNNLITKEMALYLERSLPFIEKNDKITMFIKGSNFSKDEKKEIENSLRTYFYCRYEDVKVEITKNLKNILILSIGLIASCILLFYLGKNVDVAYHEFLLILLWFFGDYLIEYVLLGQIELIRKSKIWKTILGMDIKF